jgi:hypothetical protein
VGKSEEAGKESSRLVESSFEIVNRAFMTIESSTKSASNSRELIASPLHTLLVVVLLGLNSYRAAIFAARNRVGMGPTRTHLYLRIMLIEFVFLAIVIFGVRLRGASLHAIFGHRWVSLGQALRDLGLGIALLLVSTILVSVLSGHQGGSTPDQSIAYLIPQTSVEILLWVCVSITAGVCEEAVYRGYLQHQFSVLTCNTPAGIVLSAVLFGVAHAYQGLQRSSLIGLAAILSGMLVHWCGTVRPSMFAHGLQDALAPLLLKLVRH